MKTVEHLAHHITKHGAAGIMIHTITGTQYWMIAQKIGENKWVITLGNPMGNVTYTLGTVNEQQYLELWNELIRLNIEEKGSQLAIRNQLKNHINKFTKKHEANYKKFIKRNTKKNKK